MGYGFQGQGQSPPAYAVRGVRFHDGARLEFIEEVAYYEDIQRGLGERFRVSVEAGVALAAALPHSGSPHKYGTRRVFPKRFPYAVIYMVQATEIVVFAVAHFKRKPGYWSDRRRDG